jgi:hypothetical protein
MTREELQATIDKGMRAIEMLNEWGETWNRSLEQVAAIDATMAELMKPATAYLEKLIDEKRRNIIAAIKPAREALDGPMS